MRRLPFRIIAFYALLALADYCRAWSEAGHIALAEQAYRGLPAKVQARLDSYASILLANSERHAYWQSRYPGYASFSYAAAWPDTIRDQQVEQLFKRYDTGVPPKLMDYRGHSTDNWHYTNRWYFNGSSTGVPANCKNASWQLANRGELLPAIEHLYTAFEQAESPAQRSLVLAFLVHLLSDLHQPLHNFGKVNSDCRHDRGGGGFCLAALSDGSDDCPMSLHRWWDNGAGLFDGPVDASTPGGWEGRMQHDPGNTVTSAARVSAATIADLAMKWSDESRQYTLDIYRLEEGKPPGDAYVARARQIVNKQADLAVIRLRTVLLTLLD